MARKSLRFIMRSDPRILSAAKKAAADERRSVAGYIEWVLERDLMERGYLTRPVRPVKKKGRRNG